jgi:hypothetical protein
MQPYFDPSHEENSHVRGTRTGRPSEMSKIRRKKEENKTKRKYEMKLKKSKLKKLSKEKG